MANTSVVVTLNSSNTNERKFVAELVQHLNARNIEVVADDLSLSENRVIHELLNHQWLILILTPETARLRRIQAVVNAALEYVEEGHLQGVLALSYGNTPIESEEMPYPWWSTIRTYHAGESDEDHRRAFEKVHRTVGYARVPALVGAPSTASSTTPQNTSYDTRASRPLLVQPQPAPKRSVPLRVLVISMVVLLSVFSGILIGSAFSSKDHSISLSATGTAKDHNNRTTPGGSTAIPKATRTAQAKASATARATLTAIANATATASATSQNSTSTPQGPYEVTQMNLPTLSNQMKSMQDNTQLWQWDNQTPCGFQHGMYQISLQVGQFKPCLAKGINLMNFAYQVQMTLINGDEGGIIFGSDKNDSTFDNFSLDSSGQYTLLVCKQCIGRPDKSKGGSILKHGSLPSGIDIEQQPWLTVIAINQTIYLYVNTVFIAQVNDSTAISGLIGLYAESVTQSTDVAFSNVKVWKLTPSGDVEK